jgi:predicted small lipoprotein YifL
MHRLTGVALIVLAASGCGLKGPLYLPEKSEVTIRPAPAATAPEAPGTATPETGQEPAPEPAAKPESPPQEPPAGPGRG